MSTTGMTVSSVSVETVLSPSLTERVTLVLPPMFAPGVRVTVRVRPSPVEVMLSLGNNAALAALPVIFNSSGAVSMSVRVTVKLTVWSSLISIGSTAEMVGGSFTALIVSLKVVDTSSMPSFTVTVMSVSPNAFSSGVMSR